ncbi:MAG: rRNA methyltransferase [Saprospiraceae bacterium]|nr:rRNA methyltransferase [Saprospiraceae bacterium]
MLTVPPSFAEQMTREIGEVEWAKLQNTLNGESPVSIRLHRNKKIKTVFDKGVPWCPYGVYLNERPSFTLDPAFHAGAYYVQEASSMSVWSILDQFYSSEKGLRILDLCAAPGGKSSLIASWLDGKGLLVSNEVIRNRAYVLKQNMTKDSYSNVLVSSNDPVDFQKLPDFFDTILVDAPCSGEGMFRKDHNAAIEWSPDNVALCCSRQKRIVSDVLPALKPGGTLIYSTCTYNSDENIRNIHWMCNEFGLDSLDAGLDEFQGVVKKELNGVQGFQFYPHRIEGEGFFISVLQKPSDNTVNSSAKTGKATKSLELLTTKESTHLNNWLIPDDDMALIRDKTGMIHAIPAKWKNDFDLIHSALKLIHCGVDVGKLNKDLFLPDHGLALSLMVSDSITKVDLDKESALKFLKKELADIHSDKTGWTLICYGGLGLGWVKNLGNRINNYLPNELRIRMDLPDFN